MSGFDEGALYYSDQQFISVGRDDERTTLTQQQALTKFGEFIRTFQVDNKSSSFPYADQLARNPTRLRIDLAHLAHPVYGAPDLASALMESPGEFLPLFEAAAKAEAARCRPDDAAPAGDVQVMLFKSSGGGTQGMREIKPELLVSRLVIVPGIVTAASRPKHKATYVTVQCRQCRHTQRLPCRPGVGGVSVPRQCGAAAAQAQAGGRGGASACGIDPYVILPDRAECVDQQTLKVQERPEDVPTGDLPRSMMCLVDRALVGTVSPGTRVTAVGILSIYQSREPGRGGDRAGGAAIRQTYIRVVGFQEDVLNGDTARRPTFSLEEEHAFRDFASRPGALERIFARIAPGIFGHEDIKRAIAALLFGGARKRMPDGTYRRGDINVLLLGDPSTAKSQFLKFASKTAPIAVYTSGKGSSAAGLTASVIRDPASREFYLEGGAMVLADGGIVCIDEFDKMRPEDRVAIHEAMEQQTISIAKAGITTMLRSRTSSTILSRFDLIFIVKDERSMERDRQIAQHVLGVHRAAGGAARAVSSDEPSEEAAAERFFKRYIEYARCSCAPRITDGAAALLSAEYVDLRAEARRAASAEGADAPAVPVTVRQLEAIVRISEALARMQLRTVATEAHVRAALDLFKASTMDAVRSGLVDTLVFTEEQRAELRRVEDQIRRRVAVGGYVSERKLLDELARVGFAESLSRKGLLFLQSTGDFEYRRERRLVHRMR
ncbi:hypothetical protein QBZ16_000252 [Prototheca wickerhamii]|uniref:DNA replication licensing factor MCM5 n=1 Tax=Prototheca wickerhamii TaxID=3111 RepID=A0AAD9MIM3_PROWI|nr:hypothetical protein QBZ16_000252 [Prototheca wickerhamii]